MTGVATDLSSLIERIEKSEGAASALDREIMFALGYRYEQRHIGAFYADNDPALASSAERRVGYVCLSPCCSRLSPFHSLSYFSLFFFSSFFFFFFFFLFF